MSLTSNVFVSKRRLISVLSVGIIIFLTVIFTPFLRIYLIESLSLPLEFFSYIGREVQGIIFYHQNLIQNQHLNKELGLLRRQLHETEELYLENDRLRKLLDFKDKEVYQLTAAGVIGYDPSNLSSIIIINKGKRQGISQDCAVITNDGLVGRVIEAGRINSKVLLIDDVNSGVAALIQRSRQQGLISGTLSRGLIMHYLPADADIKISDLVITSGLGGLYPKGVLIGKVVSTKETDDMGNVLAIIEPSANMTRLEEVLVVLPK